MSQSTIEKIIDIRFLVPPVLFVVFIFLSSPNYYLKLTEDYRNIIYTFVFLIILGIGIVISAVGEFTIIILKLRNWKYEGIEVEALKKVLPKEEKNINKTTQSEIGSWIILSNFGGKENNFIQNQILKRWYWAATNLNCFIGLILGIIYIVFIDNSFGVYQSNYKVIASFIVIAIVLLINFYTSYKSMKDMHKILARNHENQNS